MAFLIGGANSADDAYEIANSCKFDLAATSYMARSPSGATNRRTFTISFWIKRCGTGVEDYFFNVGTGATDRFNILFLYGGMYVWENASGWNISFDTNAAFRDPSAWSHIVIAVDTTQSTEANRLKVYINGSQVTSWAESSYPDQNYDTKVNTTDEMRWGRNFGSESQYFSGYLAEVILIDGTAYAASDFGKYNSDSPSIWQPKDPSGLTFGTNGYWLDFEDSSALGNDISGNNNDFAVTNLAAADQASDSPTNNFCTINPLASNVTLTEGNLQFSGIYNCKSSIAMQNGKWYAECKITNDNTYNPMTGIGQTGTEHIDNPLGDGYAGNTTDSYHYQRDGKIHANGSDDAQTSLTSIAQNDIVGIAVDLDSGTKTCKWYINNTLRGTQNLSETGSNPYVFWTYASGSQAGEGQWNFGGCSAFALTSAAQDENGYGNFEYAPPAGYLALCTKNLAEEG